MTWGPEDDALSVSTKDGETDGDSTETLHIKQVADLQVIDTENTYSIGMPPFDEALLGGFSLGEIIVVAGKSGVGKTTLLQDWSTTLAIGGKEKKDKLPTLWFSYEVYPRPLWEKFQVMGADETTPLYAPRLNESGEFKWVVEVIEKAVKKWGIRVVVIDHLGCLKPPKGNYSNNADAITHTVRAIRVLAKKLGLIVMFPVHVNRNPSKMADLDSIKDSSGIAQEANTVFFIGREKDSTGLLTNGARVWLLKNRKTGVSVSANLIFQFGRYYLKNESEISTSGESPGGGYSHSCKDEDDAEEDFVQLESESPKVESVVDMVDVTDTKVELKSEEKVVEKNVEPKDESKLEETSSFEQSDPSTWPEFKNRQEFVDYFFKKGEVIDTDAKFAMYLALPNY
jgi:archaellum biogenesis ATPase FlaH